MTISGLKRIARHAIEHDTSYSVQKITETNAKVGKVTVLCRSQHNVEVTLEVLVEHGRLILQAPGMGTLLVKRI